MTIPSLSKHSRFSTPRGVTSRAHDRLVWTTAGADDSEQRCAKAARSSYGTTIPAHDNSCSSWEPPALSEDAESQFAAGMWPPRAYPCTFCRREFRSAQALGGHMNVHRRDRARLRQSSSPPPSPALGSPLSGPQARCLFQVYDKTSVNLSEQSAIKTLMPLKDASIAMHTPVQTPKPTAAASLNSGYFSDDSALLPLRLQQLASQAAASLFTNPRQQQRCTSSNLLCLMPPSIVNAAYSSSTDRGTINDKFMEIVSSSSSLSTTPSSNLSFSASLPSTTDATTRKRDVPAIEPEEKRLWAENDRNHLLSQITTSNDSSKRVLTAHDIRTVLLKPDSETCSILGAKGESGYACGNQRSRDVDLELRLGREPP